MVGIPEIVIATVMVVFWLVPVAAAVWALVTLHRIRSGQQVLLEKIGAIERLLKT